MRISDWSSDVCSSDLVGQPVKGISARKGIALRRSQRRELPVQRALRLAGAHEDRPTAHRILLVPVAGQRDVQIVGRAPEKLAAQADIVLRSEERRVGKECGSTCRSRWPPYH